jgi:hypothetical protein
VNSKEETLKTFVWISSKNSDSEASEAAVLKKLSLAGLAKV